MKKIKNKKKTKGLRHQGKCQGRTRTLVAVGLCANAISHFLYGCCLLHTPCAALPLHILSASSDAPVT